MILTEVQSELGAFYRKHTQDVMKMWYDTQDDLSTHMKVISKVKGRAPVLNSMIHNVIQGFTTTWTGADKTIFKAREAQNYRLKVNYSIVPDEIEHSWLAFMNDETKPLKERMIANYIINEDLKPRVQDNLGYLMVKGVYNAGALGTFGNAMNGLEKILDDLLAATDRPCYKVPLTALTDSNIVEQITAFERALPQSAKPKIKKIFMSKNNVERYLLDYEATYGASTLISLTNGVQNANGEMIVRSRLGKRQLIGLSHLADDMVFATVDGNLLKIIDSYDKPEMTDVQISDYTLKLFFQCWMGVDVEIPEMMFIANFTDADAGYPAALFTVNNGVDGLMPKIFADQATWV